MSRFVDAEAIHQRVARCPLASLPPREDQAACAGCPYNLAYPGHSRVGCIVNTPRDIFARALARLKERSPDLSRELEALRGTSVEGGEDDRNAKRWLTLAEAWYGDAKKEGDAADEVEVSMVIARFAKAALSGGEPVEILR